MHDSPGWWQPTACVAGADMMNRVVVSNLNEQAMLEAGPDHRGLVNTILEQVTIARCAPCLTPFLQPPKGDHKRFMAFSIE